MTLSKRVSCHRLSQSTLTPAQPVVRLPAGIRLGGTNFDSGRTKRIAKSVRRLLLRQRQAPKNEIRIGIVHSADVRNFGAVLFPLIVKRELNARIPGANFQFINATGSSWAGIHSTRIDRADLNQFHSIIMGGGQVIHRHDDMIGGIFDRFGVDSIDRPTDLVFSWSDVNVPFKAWVGVGLSEPTSEVRSDIGKAAQGLNYIGARGSRSKLRLEQSGALDVKLNPDIGWLFPRLLADAPRPPHPAGGAPYMVVQALGMHDAPALVQALRRAASYASLKVVLLPLTRCWNDALPLSVIREASGGEFILVDDDTSDLDKLAILGGASLYVGQSMHGMIGTLGQARPAGICMPDTNDKFTELLVDASFQQLRCHDWGGVEDLVRTLVDFPLAAITRHRQTAERAVDAVFDDLASQILSGVTASHS